MAARRWAGQFTAKNRVSRSIFGHAVRQTKREPKQALVTATSLRRPGCTMAQSKRTGRQLARRLFADANRLRDHGKLKAAELSFRKSLDLRQQIFGPAHPLVAESMNWLANLLCEQRRFKEAEPLY